MTGSANEVQQKIALEESIKEKMSIIGKLKDYLTQLHNEVQDKMIKKEEMQKVFNQKSSETL
jgi:hypothetical protein